MPRKNPSKKSSGSGKLQASQTPVGASKPRDIAKYMPVIDDYQEIFGQLQDGACNRLPQTEIHKKCQSCIEKSASAGSCRFVGFRVFETSVAGEKEKIVYSSYGFRSNQDDETHLPRRKETSGSDKRRSKRASDSAGVDDSEIGKSGGEYPTPTLAPKMTLSAEEAKHILSYLIPFFKKNVRRELLHENIHVGLEEANLLSCGALPLVRTKDMSETRSLCDMCATGIFMGSYMCGCCGREFCLGCLEEWVPSGELTSGKLSRMDTCTLKRRHVFKNMMFVTRARPGQLFETLEKLMALTTIAPTLPRVTRMNLPLLTADSPGGQKYLPVPTTTESDLPLAEFQRFWREGRPLVLTGLRERFQLPWDPQYFIDQHGSEPCTLHDCTGDGNRSHNARVDTFFSAFESKGSESLKLKDWPPTTEFAKAFPELFADFENALPYPSYTRRTGPLNLASHFSEDCLAPDLGPKMYNAYPAVDFLALGKAEKRLTKEEKDNLIYDVKGTTNLHLDLTDAVNIMVYEAGGEGAPLITTAAKKIPMCGAIWDIFPRSATRIIREYLREKVPGVDDPIHRHCYYLSEQELADLARKGARSYRIFQNTGDAVFIPAGCAHQVRNRRSTIKIAVDFLSPENLVHCEAILEEFRDLAPKFNAAGLKGSQREDVLQLWACIGFAWDAIVEAINSEDKGEDSQEDNDEDDQDDKGEVGKDDKGEDSQKENEEDGPDDKGEDGGRDDKEEGDQVSLSGCQV